MWQRFCHPENVLAAGLLVGAPATVAVYHYARSRETAEALALGAITAFGALWLGGGLVRLRWGQTCTIS